MVASRDTEPATSILWAPVAKAMVLLRQYRIHGIYLLIVIVLDPSHSRTMESDTPPPLGFGALLSPLSLVPGWDTSWLRKSHWITHSYCETCL